MPFFRKIFAILALSCAAQLSAAPLSDSEFTEHFLQQAQAALSVFEFAATGPLQLTSKEANGQALDIFLEASYAAYLNAPDELERIVDERLARLVAAHALQARTAATPILAVIKPANYLTAARKDRRRADAGNPDLAPVHRKLNDDLLVFYVFAGPKGPQLLTRKDLTELGADDEALHQLAVSNLSRHFEQKRARIIRLEKATNASIYTLTLDRFHEASSLLVPHYWSNRHFAVSGDIVAFVPARSTVVVTGSADPEGMRIARYLAEESYKEFGHAISPRGYRFDRGQWVALQPTQ